MTKFNEAKVFSTLGASNHSATERETNDFYATDPTALIALLDTGRVFRKMSGSVPAETGLYPRHSLLMAIMSKAPTSYTEDTARVAVIF